MDSILGCGKVLIPFLASFWSISALNFKEHLWKSFSWMATQFSAILVCLCRVFHAFLIKVIFTLVCGLYTSVFLRNRFTCTLLIFSSTLFLNSHILINPMHSKFVLNASSMHPQCIFNASSMHPQCVHNASQKYRQKYRIGISKIDLQKTEEVWRGMLWSGPKIKMGLKKLN